MNISPSQILTHIKDQSINYGNGIFGGLLIYFVQNPKICKFINCNHIQQKYFPTKYCFTKYLINNITTNCQELYIFKGNMA